MTYITSLAFKKRKPRKHFKSLTTDGPPWTMKPSRKLGKNGPIFFQSKHSISGGSFLTL